MASEVALNQHRQTFRSHAIKSLIFVLFVWLATAAAGLAALTINQPDYARLALCWQIFLAPGIAGHEFLKLRDRWHDVPIDEWVNLRHHLPLIISGVTAIVAFYGSR